MTALLCDSLPRTLIRKKRGIRRKGFEPCHLGDSLQALSQLLGSWDNAWKPTPLKINVTQGLHDDSGKLPIPGATMPVVQHSIS